MPLGGHFYTAANIKPYDLRDLMLQHLITAYRQI